MKRNEVLKIKRLRVEDNLSTEEIAKEMNRTPETIRRWLRALRKAGHVVPREKPGKKPVDLTQ